eukprot:2629320-Amphidinium_carterae.1
MLCSAPAPPVSTGLGAGACAKSVLRPSPALVLRSPVRPFVCNSFCNVRLVGCIHGFASSSCKRLGKAVRFHTGRVPTPTAASCTTPPQECVTPPTAL